MLYLNGPELIFSRLCLFERSRINNRFFVFLFSNVWKGLKYFHRILSVISERSKILTHFPLPEDSELELDSLGLPYLKVTNYYVRLISYFPVVYFF